MLTSQTRIALGRTIFQTVCGVDNELSVVVLDSQLEQILQSAMQAGGGGLEPTLIENVFAQLASAAANMEAAGKVPVLLVSSKIRLFLSRLLKGRMSSLYILAYEEIPASKQLKVVATLGNRLLPQ